MKATETLREVKNVGGALRAATSGRLTGEPLMLRRHHQEMKIIPPSKILKGRCEKIGRTSLLASRRPSKSLPHEARREPRPPNLRAMSLPAFSGALTSCK